MMQKEVTRKKCNKVLPMETNEKVVSTKAIKQNKVKKPLHLQKLAYDKNSQNVKLLAGTPIISRINKEELGLCNNETFIIKQIQYSKENIVVVDDEDAKRSH